MLLIDVVVVAFVDVFVVDVVDVNFCKQKYGKLPIIGMFA